MEGSSLTKAFAHGCIDWIADGYIAGWVFYPNGPYEPVLFVDGRPAKTIEWPVSRPDVKEAIGIPDDAGFIFKADHLSRTSVIELFVLSGKNFHPVLTEISRKEYLDRSPLHQLLRARKLCREEGSLAVVCWDSAHNPIGRAKVLYDVAATRRSVVMFAYLHSEFGEDVWSPLSEVDVPLVLIPWELKDIYHRFIKNLGICFDTVWLCKPRLPTYLLGSVISHPNTKVILDLDDNKDVFSLSNASLRRFYGRAGLGLSRLITSRVAARTVASCTLREQYGGRIVRHARIQLPTVQKPSNSSELRVGFFGTARPHKNILSLAKAIRLYGWLTQKPVHFTVLGDVHPQELRDSLMAYGADVRGTLSLSDLPQALAEMDVLISGYPSPEVSDGKITHYQITAKIGDALAVGRPILVPHSQSVADIVSVSGVFVFNEHNFMEQLSKAVQYDKPIKLPPEFTLKSAWKEFEAAEKEAERSPRAKDIFDFPLFNDREWQDDTRPKLLLLWKQHDAGIYGRRVDQIARSYKRAFPNHDVRVLELLHERHAQDYQKKKSDAYSDAAVIIETAKAKKNGSHVRDGVTYELIEYRSPDHLEATLISFMADAKITPLNTVAIVFPVVAHYDKIARVFSAFSLIVDVVDNQFSWRHDVQALLKAYCMPLKNANFTIFNSQVNYAWFCRHGFISDDAATDVVPNWYRLPGSRGGHIARKKDNDFHVLYSGNMNDRVDFSVLSAVAGLPGVRLHLVGAAERAGQQFVDLIARENVVYHGVRQEHDVLDILAMVDMAVVPHLRDNVSNFMNPMKLQMYAAAGVPTIAVDVSGVAPLDGLRICSSGTEMVQVVKECAQLGSAKRPTRAMQTIVGAEWEQTYLSYIQQLRRYDGI